MTSYNYVQSIWYIKETSWQPFLHQQDNHSSENLGSTPAGRAEASSCASIVWDSAPAETKRCGLEKATGNHDPFVINGWELYTIKIWLGGCFTMLFLTEADTFRECGGSSQEQLPQIGAISRNCHLISQQNRPGESPLPGPIMIYLFPLWIGKIPPLLESCWIPMFGWFNEFNPIKSRTFLRPQNVPAVGPRHRPPCHLIPHPIQARPRS